MGKVAIITDSNSGITQSQGKEIGITVIPMPFLMDGEQFFEDINLSQDEFYKRLSENSDISTSQPAAGDLLETWERLLKEHEGIVHIPMSSGLSSSTQTATILAEDYDGKVQVVDNQRISVTQMQSVYDAKKLADAGWDAPRIKEQLEAVKFDSSIYIMVDTLEYLKRGGRVTAAGAALGTILGIKPVLTIQGEKLDSFAKAMGVKQAREIMIEAMKKDFETRFTGCSSPEHMNLYIAYTFDREIAMDFISEVERTFKGYSLEAYPLSLSVSCHIGPGALALACSKKLDCL